jgi:hypothetical protein
VAYASPVAQPSIGTSESQTEYAYTERLRVPWWVWPVALGLAAFASAEIFLGAYPLINWIPYAILLPLTAYGLVRVGGIRIRVDRPGTGAELRVDDAHIPVSFVTEVNVLDAEAKNQLLGPLAAPNVFIDDPADPTPYWVISTRHPAELAKAIAASISPR